jgi:hypothetical protein
LCRSDNSSLLFGVNEDAKIARVSAATLQVYDNLIAGSFRGNCYAGCDISQNPTILQLQAQLLAQAVASNATGSTGSISVRSCGAVGNGIADDTLSIQNCINLAAAGAQVTFPVGNFKITNSISVPAGVRLVGQGIGQSPTSLVYQSGTVLSYCGLGTAVQLLGSAGGLRDLTIANPCLNSAYGVRVHANSRIIESLNLDNVLIYNFVNGTALAVQVFLPGVCVFKKESRSCFHFMPLNCFYVGRQWWRRSLR